LELLPAYRERYSWQEGFERREMPHEFSKEESLKRRFSIIQPIGTRDVLRKRLLGLHEVSTGSHEKNCRCTFHTLSLCLEYIALWNIDLVRVLAVESEWGGKTLAVGSSK
jgi:hypothetical protein